MHGKEPKLGKKTTLPKNVPFVYERVSYQKVKKYLKHPIKQKQTTLPKSCLFSVLSYTQKTRLWKSRFLPLYWELCIHFYLVARTM